MRGTIHERPLTGTGTSTLMRNLRKKQTVLLYSTSGVDWVVACAPARLTIHHNERHCMVSNYCCFNVHTVGSCHDESSFFHVCSECADKVDHGKDQSECWGFNSWSTFSTWWAVPISYVEKLIARAWILLCHFLRTRYCVCVRLCVCTQWTQVTHWDIQLTLFVQMKSIVPRVLGAPNLHGTGTPKVINDSQYRNGYFHFVL